jgi:hypothetical protein
MNGQAPASYTVGTVKPEVHAWVELCKQRGSFQGWIGDYIVYQRDGQTYGYHSDNKGLEHDYVGSEAGLYPFAGVKPIEIHRRF